jgi:acyl carrier protein
MDFRLAMLVNSLSDLRAKLRSVVLETDNPPAVYRGRSHSNREVMSLLAEDDDMPDTIHRWIERRQYTKILRLWTMGFTIDWNAVNSSNMHKRLSLPTYPFAQDRYWPSIADPSRDRLCMLPALSPVNGGATLLGMVSASILQFLSDALNIPTDQLETDKDLQEYGADSITLMKLTRRLEDAFGAKLSGRDLLTHRTIRTLAACLEERLKECDYQSLPEKPKPTGLPNRSIPEPLGSSLADMLEEFRKGAIDLDEAEALLQQKESR